MKKVCLCGSYSDSTYLYKLAEELISKEYEVFVPNFFIGRRPADIEKKSLMSTHFTKISIVDIVVFVFHTKYGANTLMELGYATSCGKNIYVLVDQSLPKLNELVLYKKTNNIESLVRIMQANV